MPEDDYSVMYTLTRRHKGGESKIIVKGESFPNVLDHLAAGFNKDTAEQMLASVLTEPDERQVAEKVAKEFKGQVVAELPNCPSCGGSTYAKEVTTKWGPRTAYECSQDNGECVNERGYPTTTWPAKGSKRES